MNIITVLVFFVIMTYVNSSWLCDFIICIYYTSSTSRILPNILWCQSCTPILSKPNHKYGNHCIYATLEKSLIIWSTGAFTILINTTVPSDVYNHIGLQGADCSESWSDCIKLTRQCFFFNQMHLLFTNYKILRFAKYHVIVLLRINRFFSLYFSFNHFYQF